MHLQDPYCKDNSIVVTVMYNTMICYMLVQRSTCTMLRKEVLKDRLQSIKSVKLDKMTDNDGDNLLACKFVLKHQVLLT